MATGNHAVQPVRVPSERRAFVIAALVGAGCGLATAAVFAVPLIAAAVLLVTRWPRLGDSVFFYLLAPLDLYFLPPGLLLLVVAFLAGGYMARRLGPSSAPPGRLGLAAAVPIIAINMALPIVYGMSLAPDYAWVIVQGHFSRGITHHELAFIPNNMLFSLVVTTALGALPAYLADRWAAQRQRLRAQRVGNPTGDASGNTVVIGLPNVTVVPSREKPKGPSGTDEETRRA